jgi:hypothetical protein
LDKPLNNSKIPQYQFIDPTDIMPRNATKSLTYSQFMLDFINATGNMSNPYNQRQLLGAYLSSVYLFSAINLVAKLIGRIKIVARERRGELSLPLPIDNEINTVFAKYGAKMLENMYRNYAVYGATLVYKLPSVEGALNKRYDFASHGIAGFQVLDRPKWNLNQNAGSGEIYGAYVNNYSLSSIDPQLDRNEFVYHTSWNPEYPNDGQSIVSNAIHYAVANNSIAQWMSDYFTRGALPLMIVSFENEADNSITDNDLEKYRRQFEDKFQGGVNSSLRSVFLDRKVVFEQVGIPASEVEASAQDQTALQGIAAAVGIDIELIAPPEGGRSENFDQVLANTWNLTIIPLAENFLSSIERDSGLPDGVFLTLDVSHISELEAGRADKASTEQGIVDAGIQSYNEARARMNMPPVRELEGMWNLGGQLSPITHAEDIKRTIAPTLLEQATAAYEQNLIPRSTLQKTINAIPDLERDGYKDEVDNRYDRVIGLWNDNVIRYHDVFKLLQMPIPSNSKNIYKTQMENLMQMEVDNHQRKLDEQDALADRMMELYTENLITNAQLLDFYRVPIPPNYRRGFKAEIDYAIDREHEALTAKAENDLEIEMAKRQQEVDQAQALFDKELEKPEFIKGLFADGFIKLSAALDQLGIDFPYGEVDGYAPEIESIREAMGELGVWKNRVPGYKASPPIKPSLPPAPPTSVISSVEPPPPPSPTEKPITPAGSKPKELPSQDAKSEATTSDSQTVTETEVSTTSVDAQADDGEQKSIRTLATIAKRGGAFADKMADTLSIYLSLDEFDLENLQVLASTDGVLSPAISATKIALLEAKDVSADQFKKLTAILNQARLTPIELHIVGVSEENANARLQLAIAKTQSIVNLQAVIYDCARYLSIDAISPAYIPQNYTPALNTSFAPLVSEGERKDIHTIALITQIFLTFNNNKEIIDLQI